ncbi:DNA alkylation repair protein [Ammoniphilus sp. 3BR4]|uniref:DNA alkylation repair protein n=1 Tax=Ammoniphilus sp. 3BR4 TaxID=3158265 RepID=UPI003467B817
MTQPYLCPRCKTNRSRFNIIQQVSQSIKMDPSTGDIVQVYQDEVTDPFHNPYAGPSYRVQCALCSLIEDEEVFLKAALNPSLSR